MTFRFPVYFFMLTVLTFCNRLVAQKTNEYNRIINKFENWKVKQFEQGKFATDNNCIPDTVIKETYKGPDMGIAKDLDVSFTDINHDGKTDGLITFHPNQCDGGNALMNAQIRVLILSTPKGYVTDDTVINKIEQKYSTGWLMIENVSENVLYGTYYNYKKGDGHCCPSIKKKFELDYLTRQLTFTDK